MITEPTKQKTIAVIGSGVSGLTAAYLLSKKYKVDVYESEENIGGHTHTVNVVDEQGNSVSIDTGFIVFNEKNYPNFIRLLNEWGVGYCNSDMSFSYTDLKTSFFYGSDFPKGVFAKKSTIFNFNHYRFLYGIYQFNKACLRYSHSDAIPEMSLKTFLQKNQINSQVIENYILPMTGAIWSASYSDALDFPLETFIRFWKNHHLLGFFGRLVWKTIPGGAINYIHQILPRVSGDVFTSNPVIRVSRTPQDVVVVDQRGHHHYDAVVIATHADQALRLLEHPSPLENALLSKWRYSKNHTVLHTDTSFMPPQKAAWSSWNVLRDNLFMAQTPISLTYWMNRLQPLKTDTNYFVTLNPCKEIPREKIYMEKMNTHPIMDSASIQTQSRLHELNMYSRVVFCGSYFKYGFHEDAVTSAIEATEALEKVFNA